MVMNETQVFGTLELPFLFTAVLLAFMVAIKLRDSAFGRGMLYVAWGFVVMAIGHIHMLIEQSAHVNLLDSFLGVLWGPIVWIVALMVTWALSAYGFLQIYWAAKKI